MTPLAPDPEYTRVLGFVVDTLQRMAREVEAKGRPVAPTTSPNRLDHVAAAVALQRHLAYLVGTSLAQHLEFLLRQAVVADYPTDPPGVLLDKAANALETWAPGASWSSEAADVALRGAGVIR